MQLNRIIHSISSTPLLLVKKQGRFILLMALAVILTTGWQQAIAAPGKKKKKDKAQETTQSKLSKADQVKLERALLDAEKAKATEDYEGAIKGYNDVLAIDLYNANAHFQLAQIYSAMRKMSEAEQEALIATKIDGTNKWYFEALSTIYMDEGKTKEATEVYKTLIEKFPNDPDYYLNLGFLYSKLGQYDNAVKTYDQFEKNFGVDENVIQEKKNLYLRMNKFSDALNEVHKLTDAFPGDVQYMLMEAELYRANKMKDKATEVYKKVLVEEPENPEALMAMAELGSDAESAENIKKIFKNPNVDVDTKVKILFPYLQFWDLKKTHKQDAFDLAEILTSVHPNEAKAWAIKGDLYSLDDNNDKALQSYLQSLKLNKSVFQVWAQVMLIYNIQRDWTSLEKVCTDALEYFPNQSRIYLFKGMAESENNNFDKAIKSLTKGEKMSGDDDKLRAQFLATLGDTYHNAGKFTESDSAYERSLKLSPENSYVLNNYSYYLSLRNQNMEKAKQMSAYANKLEPGNSSFLDTYAWILFQLKDFTGAKEWQEKAISAGGEKSGTIIEHYGDILYQLGQKSEALEYWKKAKQMGTDSGTIDRKIAQQQYVAE